MSLKYKLEGKTPVRCEDLEEWARWFQAADRHVAETMVGSVRISTVFLGIDHNFRHEGPPILFETLVFGAELPDLDESMWRYSTWAEAERMHAEIVELVQSAAAETRSFAE